MEASVQAGVQEVNLIAQDITAFGHDLSDGSTLEQLLRELVKIEELQWIRLLYAYPEGVTDELIDLIASEEKICNYLDLPLQHIDGAILTKMNRRIDEQPLRALIQRIRQRVPNITLRTSFIVGFPGETQDQFQKLLDYVNEGNFDRVGVFCYSQEEGTSAAKLDNQIDEELKQQRQEQIMKAQSTISLNKHHALLGQQIDVLVDGFSEETDLLLQGRYRGQAPDVDGIVYITAGQPNIGDIVAITVTDTTEYDLIGEMVGEGE